MISDEDLLRDYAVNRSEAAFSELVGRHVNLVYSCALRQVGSPDLARDVAQSVFLALSRQAGTLRKGTLLGPWLFVVSRRAAIDLVRRERRRQDREREAQEFAAMQTDDAPWTELKPALDEAISSLGEADRNAIVLRYFEAKSLREIGDSLAVSEDAAQKRIARALGRLQAFFARRGIAVSGGGLAASLSAHAVGTAPATLHSALTAAVLSDGAAAAGTLFMATTALQKTLVAGALVAALGFGVYEMREVLLQNRKLDAARQSAARLEGEFGAIDGERAATAAALDEVERKIDRQFARASAAIPPGESPMEGRLRALLERVDRMKIALKQWPGLSVPELQFLTEDDWLAVASKKTLTSDAEIREALAQLRDTAESRFMYPNLGGALQRYLRAHDNRLPPSVDELAPFLPAGVDRAALQRYRMVATGRVQDLTSQSRVMVDVVSGKSRTVDVAPPVIELNAPADMEYDFYRTITSTIGNSKAPALAMAIREAQAKFARAYPGQKAVSAAQLAPFLRWPVEPRVLQAGLAAQDRQANSRKP